MLPLVINNGLSHQYVSNSSLDKFNNYTGATLSYYAAIFGGFVGGIFTYAGVKLSLESQDFLIKREAESHKNMLRLQLKNTCERIHKIKIMDNSHGTYQQLHLLIFDKNWYEHLPYIKCLNQKDLETIIEWFYKLDVLERTARDNGSHGVPTDDAKQFPETTAAIKSIIDKLESDDC